MTTQNRITPQQKGDYLEDAVRLIEQTILSSKPALKDFPFLIETKKIFIVDGVRHEIDVYVEIDMGHGYNSIFIFECKNWKDPVGKNEIIIFSEKVKAIKAQKGYFVTSKFTKDAINQASQDNRIELLEVNDDNSILLSFPDFHTIERRDFHANANFIKRGTKEGDLNYKPLMLDTCTAKLNGKEINLAEYLNKNSVKIIDDRLLHEPTYKLSEGIYDYEYNATLNFEPSTLMVNDVDIERIELRISFPLRVNRPKIKYMFDVDSRGMVITYESKISTGHKLYIAMIQTEK